MFSCFLFFSIASSARLSDAQLREEAWVKLCACNTADNCNSNCPSDYTVQDVTKFIATLTGYINNGYPDYLDVLMVSEIPIRTDRSYNIDISKSGLVKAKFKNINSAVPYIWVQKLSSDVKNIVFTKCKVNTMINQLLPNHFEYEGGSTLVLDCSITKIEVGTTKVKITKYGTTWDFVTVDMRDSTVEDINRYADRTLEVFAGIWGEENQNKIGLNVIITAGKAGSSVYFDGPLSNEDKKWFSVNSKDFAMTALLTEERGAFYPDLGSKGCTFQIVPRHPIERNVFPIGYKTCKFYRIPAMATANDGSLIAVVDARWELAGDLPNNISVMIRRSTDNGITWSEPQIITDPKEVKGFGDPSIVVDRKSGTIFVLYNGLQGFLQSTVTDPLHLFYKKSTDNGVTWSEAHDITSMIYSNLCTNCNDFFKNTLRGVFLTSGAAVQLRDGRLMVAAVTRTANGITEVQNYAIYSDDLGETWHIGKNKSNDNANEAKLIEMTNGTVVIVVRQKKNRKFVYSNDKGDTWYNPVEMTDIKEAGCDGDAIRYTSKADGYDKDRWIITIPYNQGSRQNVSILMSYDEGKTWPIKKTLDPGYSGYSSVTVDRRGHFHILYEKNNNYAANVGLFHMPVTEFTLDWLTDGAETYTKPTLLNWCICDNKEECQKCTGSSAETQYQFENKVFDSYIESYYEYPKVMKYEFISKNTRDFSVDLSLEGLEEGSYINQKELTGKEIIVEIKGIKSETTKTTASRKLTFTQLSVKPESFDQINAVESLELSSSKFYIKDTDVEKIEIGRTKIRLTKKGSQEKKIVELSESEIIIDNQGDFEIKGGIDGIVNEEAASLKSSIESQGNTNIYVSGIWKNSTSDPLISIKSIKGHSLVKFETYYDGIIMNNGGNIEIITPASSEIKTDENSEEENDSKHESNGVNVILFAGVIAGMGCIIIILTVILVIMFVKSRNNGNFMSESGTLTKSLYC